MLEKKDYTKWHEVKTMEHNGSLGNNRKPSYKEGRIYWVSIGQNIGYEEDGKGDLYTRPVLIIRGYNQHIFLGIPLTTKHKTTPFYYRFKIKDSEEYSSAILSQIRTFDTARIRDHHPLGSVDGITLRGIKDAIIAMVG